MSEHVMTVINSCSRQCALKVMRAHSMDDDAVQVVYRSVVVAKLQQASSAEWGFTNSLTSSILKHLSIAAKGVDPHATLGAKS